MWIRWASMSASAAAKTSRHIVVIEGRAESDDGLAVPQALVRGGAGGSAGGRHEASNKEACRATERGQVMIDTRVGWGREEGTAACSRVRRAYARGSESCANVEGPTQARSGSSSISFGPIFAVRWSSPTSIRPNLGPDRCPDRRAGRDLAQRGSIGSTKGRSLARSCRESPRASNLVHRDSLGRCVTGAAACGCGTLGLE